MLPLLFLMLCCVLLNNEGTASRYCSPMQVSKVILGWHGLLQYPNAAFEINTVIWCLEWTLRCHSFRKFLHEGMVGLETLLSSGRMSFLAWTVLINLKEENFKSQFWRLPPTACCMICVLNSCPHYGKPPSKFCNADLYFQFWEEDCSALFF